MSSALELKRETVHPFSSTHRLFRMTQNWLDQNSINSRYYGCLVVHEKVVVQIVDCVTKFDFGC